MKVYNVMGFKKVKILRENSHKMNYWVIVLLGILKSMAQVIKLLIQNLDHLTFQWKFNRKMTWELLPRSYLTYLKEQDKVLTEITYKIPIIKNIYETTQNLLNNKSLSFKWYQYKDKTIYFLKYLNSISYHFFHIFQS